MENSLKVVEEMKINCKIVGGTFSVLWHNSFLNTIKLKKIVPEHNLSIIVL